MRKPLFLTVFATFTTVESQINNEASHVSAVDQLVRAVGKTERFIYDELKQSVNIARSHGGVPLKPEITQDRLARRMTDLQERNKKILTRCGVGAEKQDKGEIILDSRSSGFGSFTGFQGFQPSAGFISAGRDDKGPSVDLSGQPLYAGYGDYGGGYGGFDGFGADLFGHSSEVPLGVFDPLGAAKYHTRKRRFAAGEKVTKAKIRQKLQKLNESFQPMEQFIDEKLVSCSENRVKNLKTKVNKVKDRIKKVIERQGNNIRIKQRRKRL